MDQPTVQYRFPRMHRALGYFIQLAIVYGIYMMMESVLTFYHLPVPLTTVLTLGAAFGLTNKLRAKAEKLFRVAEIESTLNEPVSRLRKVAGFLLTFPLALAFPIAFGLFPPVVLIFVGFLWFAPDYYERKYERESDAQSRLEAFLPRMAMPRQGIRKRLWLRLRHSTIKAGIVAGLVGGGAMAGLIKGEKQ